MTDTMTLPLAGEMGELSSNKVGTPLASAIRFNAYYRLSLNIVPP